jgi:signal peptidase I
MAKKDKGRGRKQKQAPEAKDSGDDARARRRAERTSKRGADRAGENSMAEWTKSIVIAVALFLFLRTFLVQTFVITSGSMEETLLVGDMLVVNRAAVGGRIPGTAARLPGYASVSHGDVLVFDPPHEETLKLIKRLIGMPGDRLEMRNRVLYRNGEPVDEPYAAFATKLGALLFCPAHEMLHAGQIGLLRRLLDKPPLR